jgi:purine catabolism regulator
MLMRADVDGDRAAPERTVLGDRLLLGAADLVVRRRHQQALVAERDGHVVLLLSEDPRRGPTQANDLADAIRRAPQMSVSIAVGPWVTDVQGITRSYDMARTMIELIKRAHMHDQTVGVGDLGVAGLLLSAGDLHDLATFAASVVDPVRAYDERRGSDLLATLRVYLDKGCSTAETARTLVVHQNTVAYRIGRIQSILGIDPVQPDGFLRIQLALIVDEVGAAQAVGQPVRANQRRVADALVG